MLVPLLLAKVLNQAPFVVTQAYESRADIFDEAAMAPNGDLIAQKGRSKFLVQGGISKTLRLPQIDEAYWLLGAFGADGFAMSASVPKPGDNDDTAASILTLSGLRQITPARYLISYTSAAGRFIAANDDANQKERAILWDGAWSFLPDLGEGSNTQKVDEDGTVVGAVMKGGLPHPCVWDAGRRLHVLPLPPGFDKGLAMRRFGSVVVGFVGYRGEKSGETEMFRQGMVWRDGKTDPSFAPILRQGRAYYEFTYADPRGMYGMTRDAKGNERSIELRNGRLHPFDVSYRGQKYLVQRFVQGAQGKVIGLGHRAGKEGWRVSALLVMRPRP